MQWSDVERFNNQLPTVTVVIPTYQRADLICESIESVLVQTYQDF